MTEKLHNESQRIIEALNHFYDTDKSGLTAHRITSSDTDFIHNLAQDVAVARYVPWAAGVKTEQDALTLIEGFINRGEARYVIEQDGEQVGYIGVWPDSSSGYYQTGSALLPEFRGQGIVNKVFDWIVADLKEKAGAKGMVAYVDGSNASSQAMIEKRGYNPTEEFNSDGERKYVLEFLS